VLTTNDAHSGEASSTSKCPTVTVRPLPRSYIFEIKRGRR